MEWAGLLYLSQKTSMDDEPLSVVPLVPLSVTSNRQVWAYLIIKLHTFFRAVTRFETCPSALYFNIACWRNEINFTALQNPVISLGLVNTVQSSLHVYQRACLFKSLLAKDGILVVL